MSILWPAYSLILVLPPPAAQEQIVGSQPSASTMELPAEGQRLLAAVRDNVFSFDDPAFYWFCRFVRTDEGRRRLAAGGPGEAVPWKALLERPSDYRGCVVDIDATVQAFHRYDTTNRADIGSITQYEVSQPGSRGICTLICAANAAEIPVGQRIRARGFFIKNRAYQTTAGEAGTGPLFVGLDAVPVAGDAGRSLPRPAGTAVGWLSGLIGVMALTWRILRGRQRRAGVPIRRRLTATGTEAESEADFDWIRDRASPDDASRR